MRHGSLFSGIGGFDYAAQMMGWENVFHCEWNEFGQRVLKHYWPQAISYHDITKTDFTIHRGGIEIISGGFPCQPYSTAGKRLGKDDERHLWPEMLRAIREIQPRWVVGENVLGLVNWNGGLVFEEVQADLEAEGYEVQPFILPAAGVNAPHRRDRVWFVAYNTGKRLERSAGEGIQRGGKRPPNTCDERDASDTNDTRLQGSQYKRIIDQIGSQRNKQLARCLPSTWEKFPTEPPLHRRDDGLPKKLAIFVVKEVQDAISNTSKENRIENLHEVWKRVQQEEIWEKIRGLYSLDSQEILFQTMQLYSGRTTNEGELSPFSEEVSKEPLRILRNYGEFRSSPQGQKLEKQRREQFADSLSFLPHEVALAARAYTNSIRKFETWHRQESIKAYGNAIVPQVALQIFKAIEQYEELHLRQAQG